MGGFGFHLVPTSCHRVQNKVVNTNEILQHTRKLLGKLKKGEMHGKSAVGSQTKVSNRSGLREHWGYFKSGSIGLLK